jgi:hypothetical protein
MNFNFAEQINPRLEKFDFPGALEVAETQLKKINGSEYHAVLGRSLTDQAGDVADWIDVFYKKASEEFKLKALYFEMNEFDINTDRWYIDGFAYDKVHGLGEKDDEDLDWLSDFITDTHSVTNTIFIIEGYEALQKAFDGETAGNVALQDARDWCEQIIIARYMELMRAAHLKAKEKKMTWAKLPIYFTEHAYDFVLRSEI